MSAILHRNLKQKLRTAHGSDGIYIIDEDGQRYLDASGGAAVSCLGHGHPAIIKAITEQLHKIEFAHTSFFTNEPAEKLADFLIRKAPKGFGKGRVAFLGSGSEAVEASLKLVRQYHVENGAPSRHRVIARNMSYHGNTLGALSIGGHKPRRAIYEPLLMEAYFVSACHPYRNRKIGENDTAYTDRLAQELDAKIRALGPETVSAFIAEPISGATLGSVPPVRDYFKKIRKVCDAHGILLVADEVMCGMGRTGTYFALEQEGICPDIIAIAKGLGAGFQPIGAMMASEKVVQALENGSGALSNGHTYMSHAVACAGALAVLETIEEENLLHNVSARGHQLKTALVDRFGDHPHVGNIRGRGLFWTLEMIENKETKRPFPADHGLAATLKKQALEHGMVCYPSAGCIDGTQGDHLLVAPPYTISAAQIDEMVDKIDATLSVSILEKRQAA